MITGGIVSVLPSFASLARCFLTGTVVSLRPAGEGFVGPIDLFEETESRGYRYRPGRALEVWFDVMLRAAQPGFERRYKGILAYLHEARCTDAFFVNDGDPPRISASLGMR